MRIPFFEDADPNVAWRRKVRFDAVLFVLFWIVMCDRATGNLVHETLGVALGTLALGHALLNRRWYVRRVQSLVGRSPRRGKSTVRDRVLLLTNGLLTVLFSASFASGLVCSQTILGTLTPEAWRMDLVYREVHVALSHWCFLAAALHAGLHGSIAAARWMPLRTRWAARIGPRLLQGASFSPSASGPAASESPATFSTPCRPRAPFSSWSRARVSGVFPSISPRAFSYSRPSSTRLTVFLRPELDKASIRRLHRTTIPSGRYTSCRLRPLSPAVASRAAARRSPH